MSFMENNEPQSPIFPLYSLFACLLEIGTHVAQAGLSLVELLILLPPPSESGMTDMHP